MPRSRNASKAVTVWEQHWTGKQQGYEARISFKLHLSSYTTEIILSLHYKDQLFDAVKETAVYSDHIDSHTLWAKFKSYLMQKQVVHNSSNHCILKGFGQLSCYMWNSQSPITFIVDMLKCKLGCKNNDILRSSLRHISSSLRMKRVSGLFYVSSIFWSIINNCRRRKDNGRTIIMNVSARLFHSLRTRNSAPLKSWTKALRCNGR
jgi:hypothetical protein